MYFPIQFRPKRRLFLANVPLLSVGFKTASSAPLSPAPYPGEVGYVEPVDANSVMSASGGVLLVNGTPPAANNGLVSSDGSGTPISYGRSAGRFFIWSVPTRTTINTSVKFGFDVAGLSAFTTQIGLDYSSATVVRVREGVTFLRSATVGAGIHQFAAVMRAVGGRLIAKNGTGTPQLLWIYPTNSAALFAKMALFNTPLNFTVDDLIVDDYPPLLGGDVDASVNLTPVNGTVYPAQADGQTWQFFTLGAGSANLVAVSLFYRVQDASNYWTQYIKRNAANTAWDQLVDSVTAGTPTNRKTTTGVGTPTGQSVVTAGSTHEAYTDQSGTTSRGTNITNSSFSTATGIASVWDASTTIGLLQSWPLTNPVYAELFA